MLSKENRDIIERRLLQERETAIEALGDFDKEQRDQTLEDRAGELTSYRFHLADIGTESMEQEKQFLLASKEGERLYRINEALQRLYKEPESFGLCSSCGREIAMERLEVVPEVDRCADCQRAAEAPNP